MNMANFNGDRRCYFFEGFPEPIWYTQLDEREAATRLDELSHWGAVGDTDYVSLQPCTNPEDASQDRHVIQDWDIHGSVWRFRAVFDGHGGHEAVDYTHEHLPPLLRRRLAQLLENVKSWTPSDISNILEQGISGFDDAIGRAFLDIFPAAAIKDLNDEEVTEIVNDTKNLPIALRCMRGTTALVSLVDPDGKNLWVASLGDCSAILGIKGTNGVWSTQTLSYDHNGQNKEEANRVVSEHPGEEGCISNNRVLGAIAVTRAIGDFQFKFEAPYIERGLLNVATGFRVMRRVQEYLPKVVTPPYVSNVPQVSHTLLPTSSDSEAILLMCSDGLTDLFSTAEHSKEALNDPKFWGGAIGRAMDKKQGATGSGLNTAMCLLKHGLGGGDLEALSKALTTELQGRWIDDTTVLVTRL